MYVIVSMSLVFIFLFIPRRHIKKLLNPLVDSQKEKQLALCLCLPSGCMAFTFLQTLTLCSDLPYVCGIT